MTTTTDYNIDALLARLAEAEARFEAAEAENLEIKATPAYQTVTLQGLAQAAAEALAVARLTVWDDLHYVPSMGRDLPMTDVLTMWMMNKSVYNALFRVDPDSKDDLTEDEEANRTSSLPYVIAAECKELIDTLLPGFKLSATSIAKAIRDHS
jgi:hypothetical protein